MITNLPPDLLLEVIKGTTIVSYEDLTNKVANDVKRYTEIGDVTIEHSNIITVIRDFAKIHSDDLRQLEEFDYFIKSLVGDRYDVTDHDRIKVVILIDNTEQG